MLFNSLQFLVFFLVATLWFFRLKNQRHRVLLLLFASCYFYMSFVPVYIVILGSVIIVDYFAGIQIENSEGKKRKRWLIVSLVANIGTLVVFKYYNFFLENIHTGFLFFNKEIDLPFLRIALPLGLSFHTFQAMSYTIEVFRKNQPAERNFVTYALYVMFYPQLVAGPIERPQNILPQLHEFRPYNRDNVKEGLARMLWGFYKKAVIADRLSIAVDYTYTYTGNCSSLALFTGAVLYAFQIYCDFSGYSDIAIGAAKVMNIKLMENFNQPFLSPNMNTYWKRWHISLSSWFYDYLYNPIVVSLRYWGKTAITIGLLVTFFISGLWHGAAWKFIVWGLLHGVALVYEFHTRNIRRRIFNALPAWLSLYSSILITFTFGVFVFVFFRAKNINAAYTYIKEIFTFRSGSNYTGLNRGELLFSFVLIAIMIAREKFIPQHLIKKNSSFYLYMMVMVAICYFFGVFAENQFIYFQF